ncbi:MAG: urease accessory protein UreF [Plesiomonas sp.]
MQSSLTQLVRMVQLTDSALPIGNFAFSNGLESALQLGVVYDAETLKSFTQTVLKQSCRLDGVALLHAHRAAQKQDFEKILEIDQELWCRRVGEEPQMMISRIGRKFAELVEKTAPSQLVSSWLEAIRAEKTPGCFGTSHAIIFSEMGIDERQTFALHQYGVASMILSAAIRLMKISHYDTQKILFEINESLDGEYDSIALKTLDDMHSFSPILDCLIGHHTQAHVRMFMS